MELHGKTETPEYNVWCNMKKRCYAKNDSHYKRWGGRGIVMCDRWKTSFSAFLADMGERPSDKHTIDCIDNDGPYCKENCRWLLAGLQAGNTRKNRLLTHLGRTMTLADWSKETGIDRSAILVRLNYGWSVQEALTAPSDNHRKRNGVDLTFRGKTQNVAAWCRELGLNKAMVFKRLQKGYTTEEALSPSLGIAPVWAS